MKKIFALLLVAVMCLSLVACGGGSGSAKKEIVGEWKIDDGPWTLIFNEDGTGEDPDGESLTWEYNSETEKYDVEFLYYGVTFNLTIFTNDDGTEFISVKGVKYYRQK